MKRILYYFDNRADRIFIQKTDETGQHRTVVSAPENFVLAGERIARIIDVNNDEEIPSRVDGDQGYYRVDKNTGIRAGEGIYFDEREASFKARHYGFVILKDNKLQLFSALHISPDKLHAYFILAANKAGNFPSISDIEQVIARHSLSALLPRSKIEAQLAAIDVTAHRVYRILIAEGLEAVDGHENYFLPLIELEKKAGEIREDGRIDFKEVGSIIQVVKGQELLRRIPAVRATDGYDVFHNRLAPQEDIGQGYQCGDNIVVGKKKDIHVAAIDGCVALDGKKISVLPIAVIKGNVDYNSGNIHFNGSVHVRGTVLPGFSVQAEGDILIENTVEDAVIQATGDIVVKTGVVGKESVKLVAGGSITARFLQNARIEAGGDVIIEDSIINSDVFAGSRVSVISKHGRIIGGKTTAIQEIDAKVTGTTNATETVLAVGRLLVQEKELGELETEIRHWKDTVNGIQKKMNMLFGSGFFENPKKFLASLPDLKKKKCLELIRDLNLGYRELKPLLKRRDDMEKEARAGRPPAILVFDRAYPGTVIIINKCVKRLESEMQNARFEEDLQLKEIRFGPAS